MPKQKKKPNRPPLEFINEPFSKPKGELVYKTCSELYPEVKRAPTDEAHFWCEPTFKTVKFEKKKTLTRSSSNPRYALPELDFVGNQPVQPVLPALKKQKSCPLFPLKSPERVNRNFVVLVEETPENHNRMSKKLYEK
uniref:Uncharacterized protein n=1 Tax=Trichobilharzia regenti TaxID=157069 RepID=A0AA85JT05_TRIRE|nr:unnamed protein product [Trichobilharzia regenti]